MQTHKCDSKVVNWASAVFRKPAADCSAQAAVMRDRLLAKQYCRIQTATARHSGHTWRWRTAYRQQRHGTVGTLGAGALDTDSNGTAQWAQDTDSD